MILWTCGLRVAVNKLLWKAGVRVAYPYTHVVNDPFGGPILYDWFPPPSSTCHVLEYSGCST